MFGAGPLARSNGPPPLPGILPPSGWRGPGALGRQYIYIYIYIYTYIHKYILHFTSTLVGADEGPWRERGRGRRESAAGAGPDTTQGKRLRQVLRSHGHFGAIMHPRNPRIRIIMVKRNMQHRNLSQHGCWGSAQCIRRIRRQAPCTKHYCGSWQAQYGKHRRHPCQTKSHEHAQGRGSTSHPLEDVRPAGPALVCRRQTASSASSKACHSSTGQSGRTQHLQHGPETSTRAVSTRTGPGASSSAAVGAP